MTIATK